MFMDGHSRRVIGDTPPSSLLLLPLPSVLRPSSSVPPPPPPSSSFPLRHSSSFSPLFLPSSQVENVADHPSGATLHGNITGKPSLQVAAYLSMAMAAYQEVEESMQKMEADVAANTAEVTKIT